MRKRVENRNRQSTVLPLAALAVLVALPIVGVALTPTSVDRGGGGGGGEVARPAAKTSTTTTSMTTTTKKATTVAKAPAKPTPAKAAAKPVLPLSPAVVPARAAGPIAVQQPPATKRSVITSAIEVQGTGKHSWSAVPAAALEPAPLSVPAPAASRRAGQAAATAPAAGRSASQPTAQAATQAARPTAAQGPAPARTARPATQPGQTVQAPAAAAQPPVSAAQAPAAATATTATAPAANPTGAPIVTFASPLPATVRRTETAVSASVEQPATATAPEAVGKLVADSFATAAAMHGAIAVRDWPLAQRESAALRTAFERLASPDLRVAGLPDRVKALQRLTPAVDAAVARKDALRANDAAYRVVYGLLETLTTVSPGGGGGAATAAEPPAMPKVAAPVDQLRQGYPAVMMAHAALLRGQPAEAKAQLDAVRGHLQSAIGSGPGPAFARRLDDLNKRRWRVVAALGDPAKAMRMSAALTRAYAEAMHVVGQYASTGGGGGAIPARALRPAQGQGPERVPYGKREG